MPGRSYTSATGYRYGFNGKENDNEVKGNGNQQDYGMRIYDPRLGKFLSVDPLTKDYPELTPYQFASNTPIESVDLDGLEKKSSTTNTDVPLWLRAVTSAKVTNIANQIAPYAEKAFGASVSLNAGAKVGASVGPVSASVGATLYSATATLDGSGLSGSGSILEVKAGASAGPVSGKVSASVGNASTANGVEAGFGVKTSTSASVGAKDNSTKNSASSSTSGSSTVSADLGIVSFALSLNPYNAFMAVYKSVETVVVAKAEEIKMAIKPYVYSVPDEVKK